MTILPRKSWFNKGDDFVSESAKRKPFGDLSKLSHALVGEEAYKNNRLTRAALVSLAILTFITFIGNFAQLQLTAALPTICLLYTSPSPRD